MTRSAWLAVLVALASACPGQAPTTAPPPHPTAPDAGAPPPAVLDATPPPPPPIASAECDGYVDHVLQVALASMRASRPADEIPTAEQVDGIRTSLIASAPCKALTRAELSCAMAAVDQAALYACAKAAVAAP